MSHRFSANTFFFFFLIIATCWGPPLLGFVEAVVPGDAVVVLEGSESDSSGSISDPEAEVAPWKVTMVKEIGPGSDPDAKRQTFLF